MSFHVCATGKDRTKLKEKVRAAIHDQGAEEHEALHLEIANAIDDVVSAFECCEHHQLHVHAHGDLHPGTGYVEIKVQAVPPECCCD